MSNKVEAKREVSRVVHTADALEWLETTPVLEGASFVVSLPDYSEFPKFTLGEWKNWFTGTSKLILEKTAPEGVTLFFQSDIKHDGVWIDKSFLVQRAAEIVGHELLFHKIFCRAEPGMTTYGKPAYSHLLAFSRTIRPEVARSTADVIPDLGEKAWVRGMGIAACQVSCEFILRETRTRTVVNPFCGYGSVLAVANALGMDSIGIERSPKRAQRAREIQMTKGGNRFEGLKVDYERIKHELDLDL